MLEELPVGGWMNKTHQAESERKTCLEPSCNTKTIEYPTAPSHAEKKKKYT